MSKKRKKNYNYRSAGENAPDNAVSAERTDSDSIIDELLAESSGEAPKPEKVKDNRLYMSDTGEPEKKPKKVIEKPEDPAERNKLIFSGEFAPERKADDESHSSHSGHHHHSHSSESHSESEHHHHHSHSGESHSESEHHHHHSRSGESHSESEHHRHHSHSDESHSGHHHSRSGAEKPEEHKETVAAEVSEQPKDAIADKAVETAVPAVAETKPETAVTEEAKPAETKSGRGSKRRKKRREDAQVTAETVKAEEKAETPEAQAPQEEKPAEATESADAAEAPEEKPESAGGDIVAHAVEQPEPETAAAEGEADAETDSGSADEEPAVSPETHEIEAEVAAAVKAAMADKASDTDKEEKKEKKKPAKAKKAEIMPLKPILGIANIVYTTVIFGVIAAAFILLPRTGVSETEQRSLAEFPEFSAESLINGGYTGGITDYFNDNVPYRDELKKAAAQLRNLFGISYRDAEIVGPMAVVTEDDYDEPAPEITEPPQTTAPVSDTAASEESTAAPQTSAEVTTTAPAATEPAAGTTKNVNEIAEGVITNGQVVTKLSDGHWWGISLFGGGRGTKYAEALNRFKRELGDDVNVYSMVVPTSGEYYLPDTYSSYNASHQKSIDSIDSMLDGVISVPASAALWEHTGENIYLRTDHHWQPLGAYYAAKCFAETADVPFADISTMTRNDVEGYMGTMYSFTESTNLLNDPEVFTYYVPSNSYRTYYYNTTYGFDYSLPFFVPMPVNGSYSMFMGGDQKIVRISTDAGTGRKLVVFKDSYGNAEIPFYFGSFDEIYVCDMRYFDLNAVDFVKFTGATDLLFTMCTFSAVGTNANNLDTILNNPATEITESAAG